MKKLRSGAKWISVLREGDAGSLVDASLAQPTTSTRVRAVHRVGTFKEMARVLRKVLRRDKVSPDRVVLVYFDGENLRLRWASVGVWELGEQG